MLLKKQSSLPCLFHLLTTIKVLLLTGTQASLQLIQVILYSLVIELGMKNIRLETNLQMVHVIAK